MNFPIILITLQILLLCCASVLMVTATVVIIKVNRVLKIYIKKTKKDFDNKE